MNRLRYPILCREGWYYLVVMGFILGGALMRQINLLMVLFGMMAGPLLFNLWAVTSALRKIRVRRRLPDAVVAGDPLLVEIEAENCSQRGPCWALVVEDRLERVTSSGKSTQWSPAVMFTHVPAAQTRKSRYRGVLTERGRYRFEPLKVSTRFPLGLIARSAFAVENESNELLVYPRLGVLAHSWTRVREEAYQRSRKQERRQGLVEGDFHNLRPWRSGDSRRWVHWRTTARRGELMVRQFEQHFQRDLAVLVELWQPGRPSQDALDDVELAVSFAASICTDLCRRGGCQLVLGLAGNERKLVAGPASQTLLQEAMTELALIEADSTDQLPELLTQSLDEIPTGTQVVIVSTRHVDLSDTERFAGLWNIPRGRSMVGSMMAIDTSTGELSRYFHP